MKNALKLIGLYAFTLLISKVSFAQNIDKSVIITASKSINKDNVLIILDGIKQTNKGTIALKDLSPNDIAAIDVFKDSTAVALFGFEGKDGAIVVTTKTGRINMNDLVNRPKPFELNTKLNGGATDRHVTVTSMVTYKRSTDVNTGHNPLANPLVIIDGKQFDLTNVKIGDIENINSITILQGIEAVNLYGDSARNGVIVISLKPVKKVGTAVKKN